MIKLLNNRVVSKKAYQRIYNMYKTNGELLDAMLSGVIPKDVRDRIERRILKHESLVDHLVRSPSDISSKVLKDSIGKLERKDFVQFVETGLYHKHGELDDLDGILKEVISRMIKEPSTVPKIMSTLSLSSMKLESIDKELLKVLDKTVIDEKTYKHILQYLMKSEFSDTRDKLVKKFG